jgi:hypothetical protein
MAWRPHERKGGLPVVERVLGGLHRRARRQQRDVVRLGRDERVGVQPARRPGGRGNPVQVAGVVHAFQLFARRRPRGRHAAAPLEPSRGNGVEHVRTFHPLGVARRGDVSFEAGGCQQQHARRVAGLRLKAEG